jgi:hypothetical protein
VFLMHSVFVKAVQKIVQYSVNTVCVTASLKTCIQAIFGLNLN